MKSRLAAAIFAATVWTAVAIISVIEGNWTAMVGAIMVVFVVALLYLLYARQGEQR